MTSRASVNARVASLIALCVVSLNLRPALSAIGPVLEPLRLQLALSHWQAGLLTTLPVLCMGVFAPLAPRVQSRCGVRTAIWLMTLLIGAATLLRILPNYGALLLSSVGAGAGIAILSPLLSAFIKAHFDTGGERVTALMTTALCLGAALAAGATATLSERIGWPAALAAWSVLAAIGAGWWQRTVLPTPLHHDAHHARLPWRSPRAWQLTLTFGLHTAVFYVLLAWLAPAYHDLGLSLAQAGRWLSVFALMQLAGTLIVARLARTPRDRRPLLLACGAVVLLGLVMLWRAPLFAPAVTLSLLGGGTAALFALTLILPLDYSASSAEAGAWTAMMCGGGYVLAAGAPLLAGWVRDMSGGYRAVFAWLIPIDVLVLLSILWLRPQADS